jgi:AraC-like DNA-binding protein
MAPWLGLRRTATPIKRKTERSGYRGFVLMRLKMDAVTATPVSRALWFIESHFGRELTLEEIAEAGCVSRYHMSRVFAVTLGCPVMRYVRGRRLTKSGCRLLRPSHADRCDGCASGLSIAARCSADKPAKLPREVPLVREPCRAGDGRKRQIGFQKQLLCSPHALLRHVALRGNAHAAPECPGEVIDGQARFRQLCGWLQRARRSFGGDGSLPMH